jgi:hypothetical protein
MPGLGDGSLALLRETSMKKMTKKLVLKKETVSMLYQVTGGVTLRCYTAACTNDSCPCSSPQYAC